MGRALSLHPENARKQLQPRFSTCQSEISATVVLVVHLHVLDKEVPEMSGPRISCRARRFQLWLLISLNVVFSFFDRIA